MMEFEKKMVNYIEGYFNGKYKCVKYGEKWFAFYIADGDKNWGYSCFRDNNGSEKYNNLKEAQEACKQHLALDNSNKYARII